MAASNPVAPFLWGQGGAMLSPEQVARDREIASALLGNAMDYSPVDHWLQGAARAAQGLVGGLKGRWADEAEAAGRGAYADRFSAAIDGGDPVLAALAEPQTALGATSDMAAGDDFLSGLISSESGGNWNALNNEGYGGRLQFGDARLADAAAAGIIPAGVTGADFSMMSPEVQQAVEQWHFADIDQQAADMGLNQYFGQTIGGVPINADSVRAMAHLGGIGGAQQFITSGGQYNPADSNGTNLSDYGTRFGGGGQVAQAPQYDMAQLLELASDPWASDADRSIIMSLVGDQMDAQRQANDPLRQLQIQQAQQGLTKGDIEIANLLNPAPPAPEYGFIELPNGQIVRTDATSGTVADMGAFGMPEDDLTDTQRNLSWRAEQAGLLPGTPEYAEFMRSGGQSTGMALTVGPDGTVQFAQGGGVGGRAMTEAQTKDTLYATRATGALPEIDRLEQSLLSFGEYAAGSLPMGLGNYMRSEDYQVASNAGKEFLASILRKDTGAAVTPSEEQMYGDIFLPRPGDQPATLARKRQARALALEAIKAGMGPQQIENMARALETAGVGTATPSAPPDAAPATDIDALLEKYQ